MSQNKERKHFSWRRLYSLLVTFAGIIGSVICVGGFMYNMLSQAIITDEEFVYSDNNYYMINECEFKNYGDKITSPERKIIEVTETREINESDEEKIENCKNRQKESILLTRDVKYKENLLSFGSWGILFVILLVTHLPMFLKSTRNHKK